MPDAVEIDTEDLERFEEALKQAPALLAREISRSFRRTAIYVKGRVEKRFDRSFQRGEGKQGSLGVRSGEGRRSFRVESVEVMHAAQAQSVLLTTSRYVPVHEFGTKGAGGELDTIRPRNARLLSVPLDDALNPSGIPLFTAREAIEQGAFVWNSDQRRGTNKPPLIIRETDGGEIEYLFVLVPKVDVPPRLGAREIAVDNDTEAFLLRALNRGITRALEEAGHAGGDA